MLLQHKRPDIHALLRMHWHDQISWGFLFHSDAGDGTKMWWKLMPEGIPRFTEQLSWFMMSFSNYRCRCENEVISASLQIAKCTLTIYNRIIAYLLLCFDLGPSPVSPWWSPGAVYPRRHELPNFHAARSRRRATRFASETGTLTLSRVCDVEGCLIHPLECFKFPYGYPSFCCWCLKGELQDTTTSICFNPLFSPLWFFQNAPYQSTFRARTKDLWQLGSLLDSIWESCMGDVPNHDAFIGEKKHVALVAFGIIRDRVGSLIRSGYSILRFRGEPPQPRPRYWKICFVVDFPSNSLVGGPPPPSWGSGDQFSWLELGRSCFYLGCCWDLRRKLQTGRVEGLCGRLTT